jgi:hypothetical protein
MSGDMRAFRAAGQLSAVLANAVLPPAARALAERVEARLSAPVRIAVVGRPGAGKRRIVEGLLGGAVLPAVAGLPPAEIALGPGDRVGVVTGEGAEMRVDVDRFHELDPADLALIRLSAPLPLLEKIRFVVVPLEGDAGEMRAALAWAFRRADMVLWCMPRLDGPDRALWPAIPEGLRDHAYLAVTRAGADRPAEADRMEAADHFAEMRDLTDGEDGTERIARLRTALLAHVSRARREDLEGALIFLDHHLSRQARDRLSPIPPAAPAADPAPAAHPAPAPEAGLPSAYGASTPGTTGDPASAPAAARIVDLLAARAGRIAELTRGGECRDAAGALDLCAEVLEACAEIARADGGAVADLVDEAAELMVLLQLEASPGALSDAVALLLQVRREGEAYLAA